MERRPCNGVRIYIWGQLRVFPLLSQYSLAQRAATDLPQLGGVTAEDAHAGPVMRFCSCRKLLRCFKPHPSDEGWFMPQCRVIRSQSRRQALACKTWETCYTGSLPEHSGDNLSSCQFEIWVVAFFSLSSMEGLYDVVPDRDMPCFVPRAMLIASIFGRIQMLLSRMDSINVHIPLYRYLCV